MHRVIKSIFVFSITLFTIRLHFLMGMFPYILGGKSVISLPEACIRRLMGGFFKSENVGGFTL